MLTYKNTQMADMFRTITYLPSHFFQHNHKQINKILISAFNETFRQSSGPVYAHTPMRNVGGLRTFNPKLKDSAGGEVNDVSSYFYTSLGYTVKLYLEKEKMAFIVFKSTLLQSTSASNAALLFIFSCLVSEPFNTKFSIYMANLGAV